MAISKEAMITAIHKIDLKTLISLANQNKAKKSEFTFLEALSDLKQCEVEELSKQLEKLVATSLTDFFTCLQKGEWPLSEKENTHQISLVIQAAIDMTMAIFQLNFPANENLLNMVIFLHGVMLQLPSSLDSLKNNIAHICEKFYSVNFVSKSEYFLYNVLLFLLRKTLAPKALKADIKRIYVLKDAIPRILAMKEANVAEIKDLLKMCAVSNLFLTTNEGQKILSLVMTIDADTLSDFHDIFKKNFTSHSQKSILNVAKVYFNVLFFLVKNNKEELKNIFEVQCIQDFFLIGARAINKHHLNLTRKFFSVFHYQKGKDYVDKMLYNALLPVVWRFLKNPEILYRHNTADIYLHLFPLEDPDAKIVDNDLELNEQLLAIKDLLTDESPVVRQVSCTGLCTALSCNWEIFPEEMMKTYFRIIVDDLSCDSSTSDVRLAVAKGMKVLLQNPLSYATLKKILPKLKHLFHDSHENVRIAFCQVLLKVKKIAEIKYFEVVDVENLLARMQDDCHSVVKAIVTLIYNSYFPKKEDFKVSMMRSMELIKSQPGAARVFFSEVHSLVGTEVSVKFMIQCIRALHTYIKSKEINKVSENKSILKENNVNITDFDKSLVVYETNCGFQNTEFVCSLLDCIAILWTSVKMSYKPENKNYLKLLVSRAGIPLSELCLFYKDSPVASNIFYVSSLLPPHYVPTLGSLCFLKFQEIPSDAVEKDYQVLLECICNQNQTEELLQILKEWIESAFVQPKEPPINKKRKCKSKDIKLPQNAPKPYLANNILNCLLNYRVLQKSTLMFPETLTEMLYFIDFIKRKIDTLKGNKGLSLEDASFLALLLFNLNRIAAFLHFEDNADVAFVSEVIQWTSKLLKHLNGYKKHKINGIQEFVQEHCKNLCCVLSDLAELGFFDPSKTTYLLFFENLSTVNVAHEYALITARFLYKYTSSCHYNYLVENNPSGLNDIIVFYNSVLQRFCDEEFVESIPPQELKDIQIAYGSLMLIMYNHVSTLNKASPLFKLVVENALKSLVNATTAILENEEEKSKLSLEGIPVPKSGAFFIFISLFKPKLIPFYLKMFGDCLKESEMSLEFWLASTILLQRVIGLKNLNKEIARETRILLNILEKSLTVIIPSKGGNSPGNPTEGSKEQFSELLHSEFKKLKSLHSSKVKGSVK